MSRAKDRRRTLGRTPRAFWPPAILAAAFLVVPLLGLVAQAPWARLATLLAEPAVADALRLSLVCASLATALALMLGVPLAWVLARARFPGHGLLRVLVTVPLVLPPVVGGVALLLVLGRNGAIGRWLDAWFGVTLPFSTAAVVVAETFVAMPFLVITVEGALRGADRKVEEAAATLGASRATVVRRVTIPGILPSLVAGAVLCWARALGEFGATITFAGSYPGTTRTLPLAVYSSLELDLDEAVALSLVLLAACVLVLVVLRGHWLGAAERA